MANPDRIARDVERIYAHRFPPGERQAKARLWEVLCGAFFQRWIPDGGAVLDLGAGYCDFSNHIRAGRRIAVDLNPDTAPAAAPGVEVLAMSLDRIGEAIPPRSIDVAFASNVFEHLRSPESLLDVLAAVFVALKPGGLLIVMQPNVRVLGGAFWDFVDHTLPLTEKGMAEAMETCGFEIRRLQPRFLPYTTKSRLPQWPLLVRAYLALPPVQWLMGKQMLVVARRPPQ